MATVAELQEKIDLLVQTDAENHTHTLNELEQLRVALEAIKPGEPVTQAQLDQVQGVIDRMTARNEVLAADDPAPA